MDNALFCLSPSPFHYPTTPTHLFHHPTYIGKQFWIYSHWQKGFGFPDSVSSSALSRPSLHAARMPFMTVADYFMAVTDSGRGPMTTAREVRIGLLKFFILGHKVYNIFIFIIGILVIDL